MCNAVGSCIVKSERAEPLSFLSAGFPIKTYHDALQTFPHCAVARYYYAALVKCFPIKTYHDALQTFAALHFIDVLTSKKCTTLHYMYIKHTLHKTYHDET